MIWPLVTGVGFVLAVGVVIALARGQTAQWEQERELGDEEVRRRRARERARTARSGMVAASSAHRRRQERPHGPRRSSGQGSGRSP